LKSTPTSDINPEKDVYVDGTDGKYKVHTGGKISSTEFQITFTVLGKGGAGIAFKLTKNETEENALEVVFGDDDDTHSYLRLGTGKDGKVLADAQTPNVLNETEPQSFWITLDKNLMSVGRGNKFGTKTLIEPTTVPTIGTQGWLWIGWAGFKSRITFGYRGATVSCYTFDPKPFNPTPTPTRPPTPPPINCVVSDYNIPNATELAELCSTSCGGGTYTITRTIITEPQYGGSSCPALSDSISCNTQACPPPCQVSDWSEWSSCTKQCGGGTQTQTRTITSDPNYVSTACPTELSNSRPCNTECCPVDCELSDWSPFGECSTTCGGGTQYQYRSVITESSCGGQLCGSLSNSQPCSTQACSPRCNVTDWSDWSECTKSCGGGTQTSTREIYGSGYGCPDPSDTIQTQDCNTDYCPIDCVVGDWYATSDCSATCGGGFQEMSRSILISPAYGGKECPKLDDVISCNSQKCPPICQVDEWSTWSSCTQSCGGGTQYQTRSSAVNFTVAGSAGKYTRFGTTMVSSSQFDYQFQVRCTSDAMVAFTTTDDEQSSSAWEVVLGANGNTNSLIRSGTGGETLTTQDGSICEWGTYKSFWVSLNDGVMTVGNGLINGANTFMTASVPSLSPAKSLYVGFSGMESINKFITFDPNCEYEHVQSRSCNNDCCPVNCELSDWTSWGECSAPCGDGTQTRSRDVLTYDQCGGTQCGSLTDSRPCNTYVCPYCDISEWSQWSECSQTCGPDGMQNRTRTISMPAGYDATCPTNTYDEQSCNTDVYCPGLFLFVCVFSC
jgi:hypothetical protein